MPAHSACTLTGDFGLPLFYEEGGHPALVDTALILAGGESRRFGRPKAMVDVRGKPMVQRVADAVTPLAEELVVSVASGEMAEAMGPLLPEAIFAVDRRFRQGPIEGFIRGFGAAHGERVLVAPCDAPLLRAGLYRLLIDSLGDREASVPKFDVLDPVRAVYRRVAVLRVFASTTEALPSPSSLVDHLDATFVGPDRLRSADPELESFLDVNREEDLAAVIARLRPG